MIAHTRKLMIGTTTMIKATKGKEEIIRRTDNSRNMKDKEMEKSMEIMTINKEHTKGRIEIMTTRTETMIIRRGNRVIMTRRIS